MAIGQQTYKRLRAWQKTRSKVNEKDHDLLHQLANAMLGKPKTAFSKAEPGVFERLDAVETNLAGVQSTVDMIYEKVK